MGSLVPLSRGGWEEEEAREPELITLGKVGVVMVGGGGGMVLVKGFGEGGVWEC